MHDNLYSINAQHQYLSSMAFLSYNLDIRNEKRVKCGLKWVVNWYAIGFTFIQLTSAKRAMNTLTVEATIYSRVFSITTSKKV